MTAPGPQGVTYSDVRGLEQKKLTVAGVQRPLKAPGRVQGQTAYPGLDKTASSQLS